MSFLDPASLDESASRAEVLKLIEILLKCGVGDRVDPPIHLSGRMRPQALLIQIHRCDRDS